MTMVDPVPAERAMAATEMQEGKSLTAASALGV